MLKLNVLHRLVYSSDGSLGFIYYKNPSLRGDKYICEVLELHDLCTSSIFVDHHPNNPPTLEDTTTSILQILLTRTKDKMKPSFTSQYSTIHSTNLRTRHFHCI